MKNLRLEKQIRLPLDELKLAFAAIEEIEGAGRRNVQTFGQFVCHTTNLMTENHILNGRRLYSFFKFFLIHKSTGICQ